jgi:hypothetical protein
LLDLWRGKMTPRRAGVLAANLPHGSTVWLAQGQDAGWSVEAQLLAQAVDALNGANWQRTAGKGAKPKPVDRPAALLKRAQATERNAARAARFLARRRVRGGTA